MAFNQNKNPMYGQNKSDSVLTEKGKLHKSAGIPVQDANGIAPIGGYVQPDRHIYGGLSNNSPVDLSGADPYAESATQLFPFGCTLNWGDREFRYCQVNGAITAGLLVQGPPHVAHHTNNTATNEDGSATTFLHTAGSKAIGIDTAGDTDLTLNQYADGYLSVNDAEGEGQLMRIKSHPAHNHGDDPSVVITTYDPLVTALTKNSSQLSLVPNPYREVIITPATTPTGNVVGVANIDMTDDYFGWIQTKGPRPVLARASVLVVGTAVYRSVTDAGGVIAGTNDSAGAVAPYVGEVMSSGVVDTEYALIWLNIN